MYGPAGGIPNELITDENGTGHWERVLDSSVWMKSGAPTPFLDTLATPLGIPNLGSSPNAGVLTLVQYHSNQQSSENLGTCVPADFTMAYDPVSNPCANPQPTVVLYKNDKIWVQLQTILGARLAQLQPY